MNVQIQSLHFNVSEQLATFIEKKTQKLERLLGEDATIELTLKVTKPETANNKQVTMVCGSVRAEKVSDTFEESIDLCIDVLRRQVEKMKEKHA